MQEALEALEGLLPGPNSMNFRKTSEGGGGHFRPKKFRCGFFSVPKRMNFRKCSKGPLIPPSLSENHIAIFFPGFMTEEPLIMAKICSMNFWIANAPLPPGAFQKIHLFWFCWASLSFILQK